MWVIFKLKSLWAAKEGDLTEERDGDVFWKLIMGGGKVIFD